jgi:hypothetical protein
MRKNLYLFLAIFCFLALIAVIINGGYLGVFDTLYITSAINQEVIGTDVLMQPEVTPSYRYLPARQILPGIKNSFTYELENRRFSPYETRLEVTLWGDSQPGPLLLLSQNLNITPFNKARLEWSIDPQDLSSRDFQGGLYSLRINRNGLERRIILTYPAYPIKPFPAPMPTIPP